MKSKPITDKHLLYIYNKLIIPRVEYRSQTIILTEKECNSLMIPFRIMFKHKLKWARTIPNAVLDNQFLYQFRNLYELNLQAKITNYIVQVNDRSILGKFTNIRLRKLQQLMWIPDFPLLYPFLFDNFIKQKSLLSNFHFAMIVLCRQNQFSFFPNNYDFSSSKSLFKTIGGNIPIESIITNDYYKHIKMLKKRGILFLEQITSLDGQDLLEWRFIHMKTFVPNKTQYASTNPAKWYSLIKSTTTYSSSLTLTPPYVSPPFDGYNGWSFPQPSVRNQKKNILWFGFNL